MLLQSSSRSSHHSYILHILPLDFYFLLVYIGTLSVILESMRIYYEQLRNFYSLPTNDWLDKIEET